MTENGRKWNAGNQIDEIAKLWEIGKRTPYKAEAAAAAGSAFISAFKYHALEREQKQADKERLSNEFIKKGYI